MKIWIGQEYDGFQICVYNDDYSSVQFSVRIDQEDTVEDLERLFEYLGYETEFELEY